MPKQVVFISLLLAFFSCNLGTKQAKTSKNTLTKFTFQIRNESDTEYVDDPDIGFRSVNYIPDYFLNGEVKPSEDQLYDILLRTRNNETIQLNDIDFSELIPTVPDSNKNDEYLRYISNTNQEWKQNLIRFNQGEFNSSNPSIVRIELTRTSISPYSWEITPYTEENKKMVPMAHGWFDFPKELYQELFEQKNQIAFGSYKKPLEEWINPKNSLVALEKLRVINVRQEMSYQDKSDEMYPLKDSRQKKINAIIYPTYFKTMRDLQKDSTQFATFTPPGFYNRKDPKATELGRFFKLDSLVINAVTSQINGENLNEIRLEFTHRKGKTKTSLLLGGLNFKDFPVLKVQQANNGWIASMGIGNHSFYESYSGYLLEDLAESPYYGLLLNEKNQWLDSHKIGIDGVIFHFSDDKRKELHLWLLSFQHYALVGHYIIKRK